MAKFLAQAAAFAGGLLSKAAVKAYQNHAANAARNMGGATHHASSHTASIKNALAPTHAHALADTHTHVDLSSVPSSLMFYTFRNNSTYNYSNPNSHTQHNKTDTNNSDSSSSSGSQNSDSNNDRNDRGSHNKGDTDEDSLINKLYRLLGMSIPTSEGGATATQAQSRFVKSIRVEEARQVLNVKIDTPYVELLKNYHYLYKANEISNGGSFYLQSKVVRSKEALDKLYTKQQIEDGEAAYRASEQAEQKSPPQ